MNAVDWIPLDRDALEAGDAVSADAGGMPVYRVVAIRDGQAWVQGDERPAPAPLPLTGLHWMVRPLAR
jgi:hypothetical protein